MKKLLLPIVLFTLLLTACDNTINFEPVTIDGFEVAITNELLITTDVVEVTSDTFDTETFETVSIDDVETDITETLINDYAVELLETLEIEVPEMPEFDAVDVTLSLVNTVFYHENDELTFDFEPVTISVDENASFEDITFTEAGTFTFEISQNEDTALIVVTVVEDIETETLIVDVDGVATFVNVYTVDLSDDVREVVVTEWVATNDYNANKAYEAEQARIAEEARVAAQQAQAQQQAQRPANDHQWERDADGRIIAVNGFCPTSSAGSYVLMVDGRCGYIPPRPNNGTCPAGWRVMPGSEWCSFIPRSQADCPIPEATWRPNGSPVDGGPACTIDLGNV